MTIQDPSGMQPKIDSDCSSSIIGMVKQYCKIIRKPWPNGVRDKINDCIRKTAAKNGVSCNGPTPERVECMKNWCRNGALKCCGLSSTEKDANCRNYCNDTRCGFTPGTYSCNPKYPVAPIIYLCTGIINFRDLGPCKNFNPHLPAEPGTFLHELGHACGISHVDDSHKGQRQCNNIFSCCMYEILVRGRNAANCTKNVPRDDWRY